MTTPFEAYAADHRHLLAVAAQAADLIDPIAVNFDEFYAPLLQKARRRQLLPIDGVLIHEWARGDRSAPGALLGLRVYERDGIRFVRVRCPYQEGKHWAGLDFFAVSRRDYRRLYRLAVQARRDSEPPAPVPVLDPEVGAALWKNTIGYLDSANLRRIRSLGGRARRGVLLTGPSGNGKTMTGRWLLSECRHRGWEGRFVTLNDYRQARASDNLRSLFTFDRRGLVVFDSLDPILRERGLDADDPTGLLAAIDAAEASEGVVLLFTSTATPDHLDRSLLRPGRIDATFSLEAPNAARRRQLLDGWHEELQSAVDQDEVVASTEGLNFADMEELKNLLIAHHFAEGVWDWSAVREQFGRHVREQAPRKRRRVGFGQTEYLLNGVSR